MSEFNEVMALSILTSVDPWTVLEKMPKQLYVRNKGKIHVSPFKLKNHAICKNCGSTFLFRIETKQDYALNVMERLFWLKRGRS
jgi:hypothetical protein